MDILATGYFLVVARGLPAAEAAEAGRLDRVHRLEERPRRLARRRGLLHRQGGGDPSGPLPRARRAPTTASASTWSIRTRCCAARASGRASGAQQRAAAYNMKPDELEEHLPRARHAEAQRSTRKTWPKRVLPRLRPLREVDRQHHQRRCRQRAVPLRDRAGATGLGACNDRLADFTRRSRSRTTSRRARRSPPTTRPWASSSRAAASTSTASRRRSPPSTSRSPPGASAPAARASPASPASASRATCSRSSTTAASSTS